MICLKNWEIHKILCTTNHKPNIIVLENPKIRDFLQTINNFHKTSATLYVVL